MTDDEIKAIEAAIVTAQTTEDYRAGLAAERLLNRYVEGRGWERLGAHLGFLIFIIIAMLLPSSWKPYVAPIFISLAMACVIIGYFISAVRLERRAEKALNAWRQRAGTLAVLDQTRPS